MPNTLGPTTPMSPPDYSSTPCKFFRVCHCKYGTSCQFLHPPTCTIPQCPKTSCPNKHPNKCKHYLKFGSCKFADTCSYTHSTLPPFLPMSPPTCPTHSTCDTILNELETLKLTISSLSTQLHEYGSILVSLHQQYPTSTPKEQPTLRPYFMPTTYPSDTTPETNNCLASPKTSPPLSLIYPPQTNSIPQCLQLSNNQPQQSPISTTPYNHPQQTPSPNPSSHAPNLTSPDQQQPPLLTTPNKHPNIQESLSSCDQCTYKCRAKSALKRHITMKHGLISNLPSEPSPPITSSFQIMSSPPIVPILQKVPCT